MSLAIINLFSAPVVTALSSTLIHSLWQGAVLSAVTGLVMTCTRKSSAVLRYNLLVAVMALFAVVVAGTFIIEVHQDGSDNPLSAGYFTFNPGTVGTGTTLSATAPSSNIIETISSYLNRYAAAIVWVWLLIVCARCAQLVTGLRDVYYLRRKNIFSLAGHWEERVGQLCVQMNIRRRVGIVQSGAAKTPLAIGHLKPLILVPFGMLASLSADEAEAILLHELAHIRRADYLVNLLQNLMEIVFFFNPAVLWLSALIKAERENCCDDIAVARSGKVNYLKALVACEEYYGAAPAFALSLKGSHGGLKKRVARIISNKNQSLNRVEKSLLAVCLIVSGVFVMAFANDGKVNKPVIAKKKTAETRFENDSVRTQRMISDMMKDHLIAGPTGLSFKIGTDEFVVNYQKQSEAVYQSYRARYVTSQYNGNDDWIWYYHFDSKKYSAILAGKHYTPQPDDQTTGIFQGKLK